MNKNKLQYNKGEMSFGMEILLFILAIFVIWVLSGKPETENADKPFIKQQTVTTQ